MFKSFSKLKILPSQSFYLSSLPTFNFATKMRAGVTKNKKDSAGRRLGLKKFGGEEIRENQIILRQRGFKWKPGENVHYGKDHTLHASKEGKITFTQDPWSRRRKVSVHVIEQEIPNRKLYPPRPFMYHPELYPELAKNNYQGPALKINSDENMKRKGEITAQKNLAKQGIKEFRVVKKLNTSEVSLGNLRNSILRSARAASKISPEHYTSRFEIEPLFEEMKGIASQYFVPNINFERIKRGSLFNGKANDAYSTDEEVFSPERFLDRNSYALLDYNKLAELYSKTVRSHQVEDLQTMLLKMKKEKMINPHLDIRVSSEETEIDIQQTVYSDEALELKSEYEELLKKVDEFSEDELTTMLGDYDVTSKEELVTKINDEISLLDQEILIKYLNLRDPSIKEENKEEEA